MIIWTEVARRDLHRLALLLEEEAPFEADRILDGIVTRAESLATFPHRGRRPPELRGTPGDGWLELIEAPWRILYQVVGTDVKIHGILDGRRPLQHLILDRTST